MLLLECADITTMHFILQPLNNTIAPFVIRGITILAIHYWVGIVVTMKETYLAVTLRVIVDHGARVQMYNLFEPW